MTRHPSEITLQRYREKGLSARRVARIERHVQACSRCRGVLRAYERIDGFLAAHPDPEVPARLEEKVLRVVMDEVRRGRGVNARVSGVERGAQPPPLRPLLLWAAPISGVIGLAFLISGFLVADSRFFKAGGTVMDTLVIVAGALWTMARVLSSALEPWRMPILFSSIVVYMCFSLYVTNGSLWNRGQGRALS